MAVLVFPSVFLGTAVALRSRIRVTQEQHVFELDRVVLVVVLRETVLVEVSESRSETLLDLGRNRTLAVFPVDREELGQLVGPLNDFR